MLTKSRTNPVFSPDAFRLVAGDERAERALSDPNSVDLLVWNVFSSLETHSDQRWLANRLQILGGPAVREPVRIALWAGADKDPRFRPPASYVNHVRAKAAEVGGNDDSVKEFAAPVTVPVTIDSPDVVTAVDAVLDQTSTGHGGRERLVELIDVTLEQARRVGKSAAVAVIYQGGTPAASQLSPRINALRTDRVLAAALPHRTTVPPVVLREISWQQLLRVWSAERDYLDLSGQPVKPFLAHCRDRGLL